MVIVIGILATVSIVAYNGIQQNARDTSVLSDLDAIDGIETDYGIKNNVGGIAYDSTNPEDIAMLGFTPSSGNVIDVLTDGIEYCIRGYNPDGTKNSLDNALTRESTVGACDTLILPEEPIAVVQRGWYQQVLGTGNPSVLDATAANAETGDLMIAAFCITSTSGTIATPSGWTQIVARTAMGTRGVQIFAKIRQSSDGDSYSFTVSTAFARRGVLIALGNTGPVSSLVIGSLGLRSVNGTSYTNVAPSITTTADNTYILTISAEATTTDDTVAPSVTAGGATFLLWSDDADTLETIMAAYLNQTSAGTTSAVTITYQNTQTSNGAALQIGIPPYDAIQS